MAFPPTRGRDMLDIQNSWKAHPPGLVGHGADVGAEDARVMVPAEVNISLPRDTMEQIAIPASINGRDLSRGQP